MSDRWSQERYTDADGVECYKPPGYWCCFHCGETFASSFAGQRLAARHFGAEPDAKPLCQIKAEDGGLARRLRGLEAELTLWKAIANERASDEERQHYADADKVRRAIIEAEERGFNRGVADMRANGYRLTEERDRPDLYSTPEAP